MIHSLSSVNWLELESVDEPRLRWPLEAILDGVAATECRGIGLDDASVRAFGHGGSYASGALAALLGERDLECTDVGILRIGEHDATPAARFLGALAEGLGARICVTVLTAPVSDATLRQVRAAADVLAKHGVRLALEFAAYTPLRTLAEAIAVCDRIGFERCGVLLDSWHFIRAGAPWDDLRRLRGKDIALVHLNDGLDSEGDDPRRESRTLRRPPGAGTFPLAQLVSTLRTLEFDGVVSAEVLSAGIREQPPREGARTLAEALRTTWPPAD